MRLANPKENMVTDSTNPVLWRRESNRQREVALRLAKEYQVIDKERRAREHDELLSQAERRTESTNAVQGNEQDGEAPGDQDTRTGDNRVQNKTTRGMSNVANNEGDQVWLFMERVKPGLKLS